MGASLHHVQHTTPLGPHCVLATRRRPTTHLARLVTAGGQHPVAVLVPLRLRAVAGRGKQRNWQAETLASRDTGKQRHWQAETLLGAQPSPHREDCSTASSAEHVSIPSSAQPATTSQAVWHHLAMLKTPSNACLHDGALVAVQRGQVAPRARAPQLDQAVLAACRVNSCSGGMHGQGKVVAAASCLQPAPESSRPLVGASPTSTHCPATAGAGARLGQPLSSNPAPETSRPLDGCQSTLFTSPPCPASTCSVCTRAKSHTCVRVRRDGRAAVNLQLIKALHRWP